MPSLQTRAAIAEDAARTIEENDRGPLLLLAMVLDLDELRAACPVLEGHVLQFALAARVAHRAVERMVGQHQLQHGLARLMDLVRIGGDDHALGHLGGAGGLQLWHCFNALQAHPARRLQRQAGVITEGRNFDADFAASLQQQRSRGSRDCFAVDREGYISHTFELSWISQLQAEKGISTTSAVEVGSGTISPCSRMT